MAKQFAKSFYRSKAWKQCRGSFVSWRQSIDGGLCQVCHMRVGTIVHHKEKLTEANINDPNITLNFSNLELNCQDCHNEQPGHGLNKKLKPVCKFDSNGQPLPPCERKK